MRVTSVFVIDCISHGGMLQFGIAQRDAEWGKHKYKGGDTTLNYGVNPKILIIIILFCPALGECDSVARNKPSLALSAEASLSPGMKAARGRG